MAEPAAAHYVQPPREGTGMQRIADLHAMGFGSSIQTTHIQKEGAQLTDRSPVTTRRAGIAGMAGLFFSALSDAAGRTAPDDEGAVPPPCCGNGPPNVYAYGIGQPTLPLAGCGPDIQFQNPPYGKKGQKEQYAWVFTPNEDVSVKSYTDPGGGSHTPKSWPDPTGFHGIAWVLEPGYTLVLEWPNGITPAFSTRPFGSSENQ